nr:hypothetical protein [Deltaproteobacteria bacterium]
ERVHPGKEEALGAGAVSDYIYDVAPAVLWAAATEELSQHGAWMSRNDAPVDVTASTGWVVYEGEEPSRVRHDVRIVPVATHRHRLEVHRTVEHGEGPRRWETESERRDYDVELTLIRHRDPAAASAIEAEAQAEGQAAFERAVDAGAVSCGR